MYGEGAHSGQVPAVAQSLRLHLLHIDEHSALFAHSTKARFLQWLDPGCVSCAGGVAHYVVPHMQA
jgi:hypothetical protein